MNKQKSISEHISTYANHLRLEEKSTATIEKYLRDLRNFTHWLDGREITKERAAEWKAHLTEQGYAPASVNAMLSALNGLLDFLDPQRLRRPHRRGKSTGQGAAGPADGDHLRHRNPGV